MCALESNLPPEWEQADPQETQLELRALMVPNWTNGVGGHVTKNTDNITVARVLTGGSVQGKAGLGVTERLCGVTAAGSRGGPRDCRALRGPRAGC